MADFSIKRNDLAPTLAAVLKDANGNPIDLTDCSVKFHMATAELPIPTLLIDATATMILPATSGQVVYTWLAGDTSTSGTFYGEFEITLPSGKLETVPDDGFITIQVNPDLV